MSYISDNEKPAGQPFTLVGPPNQSPDRNSWGTTGFTTKKAAPKAPARAPVRRAAPAPKKSVGSTRTGNIVPVAGGGGGAAPTAPAAPPQSIDEWLANDATYKGQNDAFSKAWADYQAQKNAQEGQYRTGYTRNTEDTAKQRGLAADELTNDYASRSLLGSGLYGKAFSDLQTEYDNKQKTLDTGLSDFVANLLLGQSNFKSEQDLAQEKAKQDAINRRAASYSL